ncbi:MAG: DUF4437 domain-containing protein [Pseudomonadota bacterium]
MSKLLIALTFFVVACLASELARSDTTAEIVSSSDLRFQPLNPARGDASPRAGVLWGDIRENVSSGAIIEFADGFSSPPHIHNVTYRGIVISGAVHNDDPNADVLWMGPGSFWTQPAGESHITAAAVGSKATIFLEILEGPYLVQPAGAAFDNGERPLNLESSNLVWLGPSDVTWIEHSGMSEDAEGPKMAFLWGAPQDHQRNGTLLRLPAGFDGELRGNGAWLRAVVVRGPALHRLGGESSSTDLQTGSYFGANGEAVHNIVCEARDACLIYVSAEGKYSLAQ